MNGNQGLRLATLFVVSLLVVPAAAGAAAEKNEPAVDPVFPTTLGKDWASIASDIETKLGVDLVYVLEPSIERSEITINQTGPHTLVITANRTGDPTISFDIGFQERKYKRYFLGPADVLTATEFDSQSATLVTVSLAPGALAPHNGDPEERTGEILHRLGIPIEDGRWRTIQRGPDATDLLVHTKVSVNCPNCTTVIYHTPDVGGANWASVTFTSDGAPIRVDSHRWLKPDRSEILSQEEARQAVHEILNDTGLAVQELNFSKYRWISTKETLHSVWRATKQPSDGEDASTYRIEIDAVTGGLRSGPGKGLEGETGDTAGGNGTTDGGTSPEDVGSKAGTDGTRAQENTSDEGQLGAGPEDDRVVPTGATGLFAALSIAIVGFNAWRRRRREG